LGESKLSYADNDGGFEAGTDGQYHIVKGTPIHRKIWSLGGALMSGKAIVREGGRRKKKLASEDAKNRRRKEGINPGEL